MTKRFIVIARMRAHRSFSPFTTPRMRGVEGQGAHAPQRKWMLNLCGVYSPLLAVLVVC